MPCRFFHLVEEHLIDQFSDGLTDVAQHLLAALAAPDGHSGIDRQPGQEVVATSLGKLVSESLAPVLRPTFPTVHMEACDNTLWGAAVDGTKPMGELFADG